jgi:hypothetical protein
MTVRGASVSFASEDGERGRRIRAGPHPPAPSPTRPSPCRPIAPRECGRGGEFDRASTSIESPEPSVSAGLIDTFEVYPFPTQLWEREREERAAGEGPSRG